MVCLRRASDIDELLKWRMEVLGDVFGTLPDCGLLEANRSFYDRHIKDGSHIAYIAAFDGEEAGCGAVCLYDEMPSPDNPEGRCAYIMNIYVRRPFRKRGIATSVVKRLVADARALGCGKIYLETTEMAEPMYKSIGFQDMSNYLKYDG